MRSMRTVADRKTFALRIPVQLTWRVSEKQRVITYRVFKHFDHLSTVFQNVRYPFGSFLGVIVNELYV